MPKPKSTLNQKHKHRKHNHHRLIITPTRVTITNSGEQKLSATLLDGFAYGFSAYLLDSESGAPKNVTADGTTWEPFTIPPLKKGGRNGQITCDQKPTSPENSVKAESPGWVGLRVTYESLESRVEIFVDASDLMLYAPDGYVYRIPTAVWTSAKDAPPEQTPPTQVVVRYDRKNLPAPVKLLLDNEVTVANIPEVLADCDIDPGVRSNKGPGESDNITCFLLNLNSILLSYSPPMSGNPAVPENPLSEPVSKARAPSSRRKR